jgi:hypothetical protein
MKLQPKPRTKRNIKGKAKTFKPSQNYSPKTKTPISNTTLFKRKGY